MGGGPFSDGATLSPRLSSRKQMHVVGMTTDRDITRLDVRLLMAFEALSAERNVTRAAERIGLTQQGMSGQLARLRRLFDDPLFVRARGGVVPTPRAEELARSVRTALAGLEDLVKVESFDPGTFEGTATIAASDYALVLILPALLHRLRSAAPGLRLMIRPADATTLAADMAEARVDLAITVPGILATRAALAPALRRALCGRCPSRPPDPGRAGDAGCVLRAPAPPRLSLPRRRGWARRTSALAGGRTPAGRVALVVPGFSVVGALARSDRHGRGPPRTPDRRHATASLGTFETPVPVEGFRLECVWPPAPAAIPAAQVAAGRDRHGCRRNGELGRRVQR